MKIGVLTGGGDCPGLNAVIRAIVRKGSFHYEDEFVGFMEGWRMRGGEVVIADGPLGARGYTSPRPLANQPRAITIAMPWPPPMQAEPTAYFPPVRCR